MFNPTTNQLLLFGGTNKRGGPYLNDTWILEDEKWTKVDSIGPSPRGFCAVAYHDSRKSIVIHGGRGNNSTTYSDLWEWDGHRWTQIETNNTYKVDHHQMVYLEEENALMAFGGWNGEEVVSESWKWSEQWEKLDIISPPKRAAFGMAFNKNAQSINIYGGLWINGQYADLWKWEDGEWSALCGPYDNSSLDHHAMIYDEALESIIGFGGKDYRYQAKSSTFRIDQNKIIPLDIKGPSARHSFGFAYDPGSQLGYLFGGKENKDGEQLPLDDLWIWDGKEWEEIE